MHGSAENDGFFQLPAHWFCWIGRKMSPISISATRILFNLEVFQGKIFPNFFYANFDTLPETNSSHLEIDPGKRRFLLETTIFKGELLVSGSVHQPVSCDLYQVKFHLLFLITPRFLQRTAGRMPETAHNPLWYCHSRVSPA